jgi:hypothetical protein
MPATGIGPREALARIQTLREQASGLVDDLAAEGYEDLAEAIEPAHETLRDVVWQLHQAAHLRDPERYA